MSHPIFRVIQAGPLAQLQDAGRFGVRHLGLTQGGPMDLESWALANQLLDNAWGCAVLEITVGGLILECLEDVDCAMTGADLGATVDKSPIPLWQSLPLKKGQRLAFGSPKQGLRAYLAVKGGFDAPRFLESCASVQREQLGGHKGDGSRLSREDVLFASTLFESASVHKKTQPRAFDQITDLDLIPGAQVHLFSGRSLFQAFNHVWKVDLRADRMGVRLTGNPLQVKLPSLISEGIGLGAVQVPPDGCPIVLLNDRQTIGGYPKLGSLTPLACARLAQVQPGQSVRFRACGQIAASEAYAQFLSRFQ
ncbi:MULTISPECIES: 5-oxoprolinase subunit C family protein [Nitrincola]|uniref:Allophanate hydrolase subunit 2 n=1 Tax=Nitrincola nitratireducens TaxID=1229521 RepID=W9V609_9GAMM|nr:MULTISPECIES: biotin-dependent carboxyltransferase family protein [Nitrincola]EXJ12326.1 Allophanate hydrolase subunit 2 [Nitrincola nitratireducens]